MQLIIAEKPSVAKDLADVLPGKFAQHEGYWEGPEHLITWAIGHLLELKEPEDYSSELSAWLLDSLPIIPGQPSGAGGAVLAPFQRKARSGMSKQLRLIKNLAERADVQSLVNACDAAREGELIFREIEDYIGVEKPVYRLWLQSMTAAAIRSALASMRPEQEYDGLSQAAYCRAEADWLIGMNATRGITKRLKGRRESGVWSAGRVQTPTLALLVHREMKVLAHVPVPFWRLKGEFEANGHRYSGQYRRTRSGKDVEKIWDEAVAKALHAAVAGRPVRVTEKVTESQRKPPALYQLTSLQKAANSRYGMSARRTLQAAQRLYADHKVLTYPRTDSDALPTDYRGQIEELFGALAGGVVDQGAFSEGDRAEAISQAAQKIQGEGPKNLRRHLDDKRVSDHHAIIPTGTWPSTPLGGDDAKVFELVLRRFLAAFLGASTWQHVVRESVVAVDPQPALPEELHGGASFFTESRRLVVPGWQLVDNRPSPAELLGELGVQPGEETAAQVVEVELDADQTRPPARYTETTLLQAMEQATDLDLDAFEELDEEADVASLKQSGLGTPATRADTIESLIAKGYVMRSGRTLRAAAKGITLIDFLERLRINNLAKPELTADMEAQLHLVEEGKQAPERYMEQVVSSVRDFAAKIRHFEYEDLFDGEAPVGACPRDGQPVLEGLKGYRCSKEAEGDRFAVKLKGMGAEAKVPLAETCERIAQAVAQVEGVAEAEAQPKRTNGVVAIRRDRTAPVGAFLAALRAAVEAALPAKSVKEWAVETVDAEECGFTIWKEFRGRYLNRPVVETLLKERESPALDGFVSMRGESYAGKIRLNDEFKLEFEPVKDYRGGDEGGKVAPELVSYSVDASPFVGCPKCGEGQIIETPTHFECRVAGRDKGCGLKMPRTVCKREMTRRDLQPYFAEEPGHTDWIEDFISRKGRAFTARLVRKPNGRHGFEFKPREGGPPRKKSGKKKAAKKATKKKTAKKKATRKKAKS